MSKVGFQDFWIAGSRFYFKRDAIDGVAQPWLDLGTIDGVVNPSLNPEKVELRDPDGGIRKIVDTTVTSIEETYELGLRNLNLDNLSLLFLANAPTSFSQTAGNKTVTHALIAGRLFKVHDDDTDATNLYGLSAIAGIYSGTVTTHSVTAIDASARTLTLAVAATFADGDLIIVAPSGLANPANSRTYTVDGAHSSATTISVIETPSSDETSVTVAAYSENSGTIYAQGTDWDVVSADRGLAKCIDGGAITSGNYTVVFGTSALSGNRVFNPQTAQGAVTGDAILIYSRNNNADQSVREMRASITPSGANFQDTDFSSMTLSVSVISEVTDAASAGRFLQFKGSLPTKS